MSMNDDRYILMVGNSVDGHRFEGPFDCPNDAAEYAERYCKGEEWWVVDLLTPEPEFDPIAEYEGCGDVCCDDVASLPIPDRYPDDS